jgi:hypothetical protein
VWAPHPSAACYPCPSPTAPGPSLYSLGSSHLEKGGECRESNFWHKVHKTFFLNYDVHKDSWDIFVEIEVQKHGILFLKTWEKLVKGLCIWSGLPSKSKGSLSPIQGFKQDFSLNFYYMYVLEGI